MLAEGARRELKLDRIFWVPVNLPPHKNLAPGVTKEDRSRMVELAIRGNPYYKFSRIELDRPPPSYSIDTVKQLRKEYPDKSNRWFFLIGSENGRELAKWKNIDELRKLVTFVVVARPGDPAADYLPGWVRKLPVITANISSSQVRQRVRRGLGIRSLAPEPVVRYIETKGLYR